ncbi:MAG: hypothetical protein MIO92_06180 [Methanosarcinaceae archaeon]|nr:hypothetical protein [Methanosarcinaceae archaeon]
MVGHVRVVQHTVDNLQFSDTTLTMFCQPGLLFYQIIRNRLRNPAVPFAKQCDEVGATVFNFCQANGEHLAVLGLFLRYTPAQIHLGETHAAFHAHFSQLRKDLLYQNITLLLHILECG